MYEGVWEMICIGAGPGPKNVLARRAGDGKMLVVAYATWKYKMEKVTDVYTSPSERNLDAEEAHMQDGTYDAVLQLLEVKGRKAGNSYVYDCKFSDNTSKALWDADMARQISELKDGPAFPVRYTVKHNTKNNRTFENMTIEAFALPGDELPFSPDAQAAPAVEVVAAQAEEAKKSGGGGG